MNLSARIGRVKPSSTMAASAKAKALIAQGIPVINFGPGEPDFDTPEHIKSACIEALNSGVTKYGPVPGFPKLREAICDKLQRANGVTYTPEEIIVTCGAKEAIFAALQVLIDQGDEVVIPAPYWVSYADQTLLCDGTPNIIPTTDAEQFKITPASLIRALTKKSKALLLNSPCNPTGTVYSHDELAAIGAVCKEHGVWVITDEIYEDLVYAPATFTSFATACPEHRDRTLIVNGVSKAYAMTGWRIGWTAGPADFIKKMCTWQGQVVSHACAFAQHGAIAAYTGTQEPVAKMRAAFQERRDYIVQFMNSLPAVSLVKPEGAFYVFPNLQKVLGKSFEGHIISNTSSLADYLLDKAQIAVVAGEGFGAPGYLRFSYALSMDDLKVGLDRFAKGLQNLS
jgi:aspartate aminotransferase